MEENNYDEVINVYDSVKSEKKSKRTDSYFDGSIIEYIGYKLLAFLITVVTLTIAKPWADKLILEYKINHTVYNGKRLNFVGKGSSLFVQRFKWCLLTIITLGIYGLWVPIKMEKWVVSNIYFEDEDYISEDSYFDGKLLGLIGVNLFTGLLTLVSLGLLFPFGVCYKQKWIAKHTIINRKRIVFDGTAISLIGNYLLWWFLTIITFGLYGLWLPMKVYGWQVKRTHIKLKDEIDEKTSFVPMIIGVVLVILVTVIIVIFINVSGFTFKGLVDYASGSGNLSSVFPKLNNKNFDSAKIIRENDTPISEDSDINSNKIDVDKNVEINNNNSNNNENNGYVENTHNIEICNSGYTYYEGRCYDMSSRTDPTISCDSMYATDGMNCYEILDKTLCDNSTENHEYINGNCVNLSNPIQMFISCNVGFEKMGYELDFNGQCFRYTDPNY